MKPSTFARVGPLLAAAALVAACTATPIVGSGTGAPATTGQGDMGAATVLKRASETSRVAGTVRFDLTTDYVFEIGANSTVVRSTGSGVLDFTNDAMESELTTVTSNGPASTSRTITIGGVQYEQKQGGPRWTSTHRARTQSDGSAPVRLFDILADGATGEPEELGPAQVRGTQARHFTWTVDERKLAAPTPSAPSTAPAVDVPLRVMDVYVDGAGRVCKIESKTGGLHTTTEFYEFGVPVSVRAPDPTLVDAS